MNAKCIIGILIAAFILVFPSWGEAIPDAAHAMDPEKSVWRNYYRDKFFVEIHQSKAMLALNELSSEDFTIDDAVELRFSGKWKKAINLLSEQMADPEVGNLNELIYTTALIFESVGFFTEAAGNYSRLEKITTGNEFLNAMVRESFAKSIDAVKYSSFSQLIEADRSFLKVFRRSDDTSIWSNALAGHAVILYIFNEHRNAEKIFEKLEDGDLLTSQYHFIRAENFMSMGYLDEAEFLFKNLLEYSIQNSLEKFQSYIYLRLGDVEAMRGDLDAAAANYSKMKVDWESSPDDPKFIGDDHFIMWSMASAEVSMLKSKMAQALKHLGDLSKIEKPLPLEMDKSIALYSVFLYADSGLQEKAFAAAKHFLLIYGKTPWRDDVWDVIDNYIYKIFADSYATEDYYSIINKYYKNIRYVRKRRALLLASEAFLEEGLPMESKKIYLGLLEDIKGQSVDIKSLSGLVKSHLELNETDAADKLLKKFSARNAKEKIKKAILSRHLADSLYRSGRYEDAVIAYDSPRKVLPYDARMELKFAVSLAMNEKKIDSIKIYKEIVDKSKDENVRAEAMIGIGMASFDLKRYRDSVRAFRSASKVAVDEQRPVIFYFLGETSHKLGNRADARKAWESSVETGTDSEYVYLSRERLKEITQWEKARM